MNKRRTLADLKWGTARSGEQVAKTFLLPGESLYVEGGEFIYGPVALTVVKRANNSYRYSYKPLPASVFDIDDPYEYPCKVCGAPRHAACVGDNSDCMYRVFYHKGGVL